MLVENAHCKRSILIFGNKIKNGDTAVIYSGIIVGDGLPVAFKVVSKEHHDRLLTEYMIMRSVWHENILRAWALDFSVHGHDTIMTMDLAQCDLYRYIQSSDDYVPAQQLDQWMEELVSAVSFIHSKDYIHGDLNYTHILLTTDLSIRVTGFGSAEKRAKFQLSRGRDPMFVPPELRCRLSEPIPRGYDPRLIDVWSVGILMFYALTKQPPFTEIVTMSATDVHGNCPGDTLVYREDRNRCSASYSIVLSKLMDFNVRRRPQLVHIINQNFFNQPQLQDQLIAEQMLHMYS